MTDKEMLELAAKAAGELTESWYGNEAYFEGVLYRWNPLTDDGDALRLAVKLNMDVCVSNERINAVWYDMALSEAHNVTEFCDEAFEGIDAKHAATRRAITHAAAEIGKQMIEAAK